MPHAFDHWVAMRDARWVQWISIVAALVSALGALFAFASQSLALRRIRRDVSDRAVLLEVSAAERQRIIHELEQLLRGESLSREDLDRVAKALSAPKSLTEGAKEGSDS